MVDGPVSRNHQHDGAENLNNYIHPDIGKDGAQNPVIFPELSDGDAAEEHKGRVQQIDHSVKHRVEGIGSQLMIKCMDKGVKHIHKRNIP